MQKQRCSWLMGMGLCAALSGAALAGEAPAAGEGAASAWRLTAENAVPAGQNLRGFGRCALTSREFRSGERAVTKTEFRAETLERAKLLAGKFLGDLRQSHQVARKDLDVGGAARPAFVTAGGQALAVAVDGVTVSILGAPDHATLAAYAAAAPADFAGAVADLPSPGYMNRYEWGIYGVSGVNDDFGWQSIDDGKKGPKDPREDMMFLKEMGNMHFDNWVDQFGFDSSDGLSSGRNWKTAFAEEHDIPYAHRFYVNAGGADWTARRFGEYMERPAWFLQNGWHGRGELFWKAQPHFSWFSSDIQGYLARRSQKMMQKADSPAVRGWMHPHGELVHHNWYDMHGDYSVHARRHWINYLKKHGVTLEEASRMYRCGDAPFVSFDQVPVPEFATFAGLPGRVLCLAGEWMYRKEFDLAPQENDWWKRPAAERYPGLREKWYAAGADMAAWRSIDMPGSDHVFEIYGDNRSDATAACWFRRHFAYDPEKAGGKRVWLYFFPISDDSVHSGERARHHEFFLNGEKVGEIGRWGALDVTERLKKGDNLLAFHLYGNVWDGRIFLSTDEPRVFPNLGPDQNRLYQLWSEWRIEGKYEAWEDILDAMRQVDPIRPIKFMAPVSFGGEKWRQLCLRYGGWPHFTGEGFWFFPWYKRYAKLYGLPATSELGSPHPTLELQAEGFRRTFLAGLDGHEPVFVLQVYSRNPQVRQWWLDHRAVLQRMGKYDIYGPQVLLYRSSWNALNTPLNPYPPVPGQKSAQSLWDWDLGRGSLQAIGQSYLYLDDDGLADGKMYGYPLIIDGGNETFAPGTAERLRAWVENGGVFVALPFTGRHDRTATDVWPVAALTGCKVAGERPLGGTVTFAQGKKIFADLAGRQFPDNGRCLDWLGNNSNRYSVELEPGEGCEVLATYENGRAAVVARRLGKGMVISFGSAFWRAAQDRAGIWWPEEGEEAFLRSLLRAVNFPQPLGETNDRLVWAQPYRANNGLDMVSCLVNWHETGVQRPQVSLRLPRRPAKLVSYGVDGVKEIPFVWEDGVAKAEVEMPAREVKVLAAETFDVKSAVGHWWGRQQELWQELARPRKDFSRFDAGKWEDPALDLASDVRFTNDAPQGDEWLRPGFKDAGWKQGSFAVFNFEGAKDGAPLWARRSFTVKPGWLDNGLVRLISGAWVGPHYLTPARLWLNGTELHGFTQERFNEFAVQHLLRPGENVLAMEFKGGEKFIGLCGAVFLNYRKAPEQSLSLNGVWHGLDAKGGAATLRIPGAASVLHPARTLFVPADWKGRYRVRLFLRGERYSILGAWVNGRLVRRHHHHLGSYCDIDVTDFLRFGEENRLELAHGTEFDHRELGKAFNMQLDEARLDLFPVQE